MTHQQFDAFCSQNDFRYYADIEIAPSRKYPAPGVVRPAFRKWRPEWSTGYVYLWVEEDPASKTIKYIGEAGGTMRARCKQHEAGFRSTSGSPTGKKLAQKILDGVAIGKRYRVYGQSACAPHSAQNRWIAIIQPPWNTIGVS